MNHKPTPALVVKNAWELKKKEKKQIAKKTLQEFYSRVNNRQTKGLHGDITVFYHRHGETHSYFQERDLTLQSLEDYINKLPKTKEFKKKVYTLNEIIIPANVYDEIIIDNVFINGVLISKL